MDDVRYYTANGKRFYNKLDAILEASTNNTDIEWYFNDEEWNKFDWTTEPALALTDYYRIRAQQIRDDYDYVVISASGGADSTNVIKTFLKNNIKIDEIVAGAPMSGLRDFKANNVDTSHSNTMSETIYTQIPLLREIAAAHPEIKITLHDYFIDMQEFKTDAWLQHCDDWIHPSGAARYRLERHKHLRDIADSGKRLAIVYGIDKPFLHLNSQSGNLYSVTTDLAVNVPRPPFDRPYPNVDQVLFYWSRKLPEIIAKQTHILAKCLHLPEHSNMRRYMGKDTTTYTDRVKYDMTTKWQRSIIPIIYPDLHERGKVFQASKPQHILLGEHDQWFYNLHGKTRMYEMIVSDTRAFYNSIKDKYKDERNDGFIRKYKAHKIGTIDQFKPNIIV